MALTKGVSFTNARSFVTETYGAQGFTDTLAVFGRPEREVLESVLSMGWYDLALYARLIRAIDRRFGEGDLKVAYALGRYEADKNLPMFNQWVMRLLRPSPAVKQIGKYWRRFHDTGEWMVERRGEREILARLTGWGVVDAALCRELTGYIQRTLELLGGGDITLDHPRCRARGEPECEFRARYSFRKDREEPRTSSQTSLSRAILLEALRGSPSQSQPSADATPNPESGAGRFRSSRPPPASEKDTPRSERWPGPPSSSGQPSAPRPSSLAGPSSTPRPSPMPNPPSSPVPPPMRRHSPPPRSSSSAELSATLRSSGTARPPPPLEPAPPSQPPSMVPPPSTRRRGER